MPQATLKAAAGTLNMDEASLAHTFEQIAGDPYTLFICEVWASEGDDKTC